MASHFVLQALSGVPLVEFLLVEPRLERLHRDVAVLVLGFQAGGHNDSAGEVGDPHRGVGLVDVLAARAAGAEGVDADVLVLDVDLDVVVDVGVDPDPAEAGVTAGGRVVGRDADKTGHPGLGLQAAIGVLAADLVGRRLDPCPVAFGFRL